MRRLLLVAVLIVATLCVLDGRAQEEEPIVREIEIRFIGPETVHRRVVAVNIQTAVGQPRSREVIEQDIRNLIDTGFFFDVRVLEEHLVDGVQVIFQVQGKSKIKQITFEGFRKFDRKRLDKEIDFETGDILDERKVHDANRKITELYQKAGYADAQVEREILLDRDTGQAVVKFIAIEGRRIRIKRIQFRGVRAFKESRLLKLIKTRRHWWGAWLSGAGVLRDEILKEDLERVRELYISHGYLDMEIVDARTERVGSKWIILHMQIFEGSQYKVGNVEIRENTLFPVTELQNRIKMKSGETFTPDGMIKDIRAIEDYYGTRGYLDTFVQSYKNPNVQTGRIDLNYRIHEGELAYIEKIEIRGNTKTKDKVLRRELAVLPGDIYDTVRVQRSAERLQNLGFFSKVEPTPRNTTIPSRKDLVINVEEQRTGTMTFGAGFSSIDNLIGFVELTQGNFDLWNWPTFTGGGQKLRVRAQVGLERQDYLLSFTEPWFLDQKLALGFDVFQHTSSFLSGEFEEKRTGGSIRLEKALSEFMRLEVETSVQNIEEGVEVTASEELKAEDGTKLRSSIEGTLVYDTRDSVFLTTRGNRTEISGELVGGPMGGEVTVYKVNARTSYYFPLFNNHVFQLIGAVGVVEAFGASRGDGPSVLETNVVPNVMVKVNDVPIFDRYFLGGANTLRGFSFRRVGPKDVDGEGIGGNTYANATAEYTFPIVDRVRGAMFFDIGNVWRKSYQVNFSELKSDAGVGVRLNLPVGPIRLDYGYPIETDSQSGQSGRFNFSVGYQF